MGEAEKSLPEVHASVEIEAQASFWRRLFLFTGPAFMVSVGYMDPGNWATDIAAGSQFGYRLIWVILLSNLMAILFQTLSARLGIVLGHDLAQACRGHYPRPVAYALWVLTEIAIAATDLAEVLGSAIGLHLLFGIPILLGVIVTVFDVLLLMMLLSWGIRKMEAIIVTLVGTIGLCFAVEMILSKPPLGQVLTGFIPGPLPGNALYVALGIIGATVMPHNLYLHSALVQSRAVERTPAGLAQATRFNLLDSVVALNGAFLVNCSMLILAASAFHKTGHTQVASIMEAHSLLAPVLGTVVAPLAFAVALLAAGQSSTITGTFAGQIVMEGFVGIRVRPWLRRLITRLLAIVPAVVLIHLRREAAVDSLLVFSQVVLSLQLPFALVPLLHFTSDHERMGDFASKRWIAILGWAAAALIIVLNAKLTFDTIAEGLKAGGSTRWLIRYALIPVVVILCPLLAWMILEPLIRRRGVPRPAGPPVPVVSLPGSEMPKLYRRVGIALETVPERDEQILAGAAPLVRALEEELILIHVVESAPARIIGHSVRDEEARSDAEYMNELAERYANLGIRCRVRLGAGEAGPEIARIAEEEKLDLIVMGTHGHRLLADLVLGSALTGARHGTRIPVLAIPVRV